MTIEQADKVDGMGIDGEANELVLLIADHLAWDDEVIHMGALESKIGGYINFINSHQYLEFIPQARGLPVRIKLVYEHEPTSLAQTIIEEVGNQLDSINIRFSCESLPMGY